MFGKLINRIGPGYMPLKHTFRELWVCPGDRLEIRLLNKK
jgi:hypothetical protein